MSTYLYLRCEDHDPRLRSDDEVTQHAHTEGNVATIGGWVRDRARLIEAADLLDVVDDLEDRYLRNALRFLRQHPQCGIGAVDEYGADWDLETGQRIEPTEAPPDGRAFWLAEIDAMTDDVALRRKIRTLVVRETGAAHRAALELEDTVEREGGRVIGHVGGTPLVAAAPDTPLGLFDSALADPAVQLEGRYRRVGSRVEVQLRGPDAPPFDRGDLEVVLGEDLEPVHRFPHQVAVSREELGILEAGSPVRAYLNRHAAEALVEREIAEQTLENAQRDYNAATEREVMIARAIDDLDDLERLADDACPEPHRHDRETR